MGISPDLLGEGAVQVLVLNGRQVTEDLELVVDEMGKAQLGGYGRLFRPLEAETHVVKGNAG